MIACSPIMLSLFLIFISITSVAGHKRAILSKNTETKILRNLPGPSKLGYYLDVLERVIMFCLRHEHYIDTNLAFGLFLINVNLKPILKEKRYQIPKSLREQIEHILHNNDKILTYFYGVVSQDQDPRNIITKQIISLFDETSVWIARMPKFDIRLLEYHRTHPELRGDFDWRFYRDVLEDFDQWSPKPEQSDHCMASIGRNEVNPSETFTQCSVDDLCRHIILKGTEFGYALSHRLLMLIHAKYGRGCNIFTPERDTNLIYELCQRAYFEAEYIAENGFVFADLLYELIAICSIDGHAQFLNSSWLAHILPLQSPDGCFAESLSDLRPKLANDGHKYETKWEMSGLYHTILGGTCNVHVTAVTAASLSSAVRFILQVYF